jgi:hypothetical protein
MSWRTALTTAAAGIALLTNVAAHAQPTIDLPTYSDSTYNIIAFTAPPIVDHNNAFPGKMNDLEHLIHGICAEDIDVNYETHEIHLDRPDTEEYLAKVDSIIDAYHERHGDVDTAIFAYHGTWNGMIVDSLDNKTVRLTTTDIHDETTTAMPDDATTHLLSCSTGRCIGNGCFADAMADYLGTETHAPQAVYWGDLERTQEGLTLSGSHSIANGPDVDVYVAGDDTLVAGRDNEGNFVFNTSTNTTYRPHPGATLDAEADLIREARTGSYGNITDMTPEEYLYHHGIDIVARDKKMDAYTTIRTFAPDNN